MAQTGSSGIFKQGYALTKFGLRVLPAVISASGAVNVKRPGFYIITKAGVAALTLAAPATLANGIVVVISSNTANAHTVTATGLLQTGSAAVNVATFNANAGASLGLWAYSGLWNVLFANGVSFS